MLFDLFNWLTNGHLAGGHISFHEALICGAFVAVFCLAFDLAFDA